MECIETLQSHGYVTQLRPNLKQCVSSTQVVCIAVTDILLGLNTPGLVRTLYINLEVHKQFEFQDPTCSVLRNDSFNIMHRRNYFLSWRSQPFVNSVRERYFVSISILEIC